MARGNPAPPPESPAAILSRCTTSTLRAKSFASTTQLNFNKTQQSEIRLMAEGNHSRWGAGGLSPRWRRCSSSSSSSEEEHTRSRAEDDKHTRGADEDEIEEAEESYAPLDYSPLGPSTPQGAAPPFSSAATPSPPAFAAAHTPPPAPAAAGATTVTPTPPNRPCTTSMRTRHHAAARRSSTGPIIVDIHGGSAECASPFQTTAAVSEEQQHVSWGAKPALPTLQPASAYGSAECPELLTPPPHPFLMRAISRLHATTSSEQIGFSPNVRASSGPQISGIDYEAAPADGAVVKRLPSSAALHATLRPGASTLGARLRCSVDVPVTRMPLSPGAAAAPRFGSGASVPGFPVASTGSAGSSASVSGVHEAVAPHAESTSPLPRDASHAQRSLTPSSGFRRVGAADRQAGARQETARAGCSSISSSRAHVLSAAPDAYLPPLATSSSDLRGSEGGGKLLSRLKGLFQ